MHRAPNGNYAIKTRLALPMQLMHDCLVFDSCTCGVNFTCIQKTDAAVESYYLKYIASTAEVVHLCRIGQDR